MISKEAVEEFRLLYLNEYGISLSYQDAFKLGTQLVRLVKIVYSQDIPKERMSGSINSDKIRKES